MEEIKITMEQILSLFPNTKIAKRPKEIKEQLIATIFPEMLLVEPSIQETIDKQVDQLLKVDKKLGQDSYLAYNSGKYKRKRSQPKPIDTEVAEDVIGTEYIGTAGECAVMSELIFRGYNVNRMMIDDGVDLIAVKDNIYYYVQVKTTSIRNGKIYSRIGLGSFDRYIHNQIRYIVVARYKDNHTNTDHNMFFVFSSEDISRAEHQRCIKKSENGYNIKIRFDEHKGTPILYDEREMEISWNLNKFDL